jgi:beta-glucosidase
MLKFPSGFKWGVSSAAYCIEGAWNEDGKGESIWDRFVHQPGHVADGTTGDVACDHYHRVEEDVGLMAGLGLDFYRFSIAWPRIFPEGTGRLNPQGLDFYERLVDRLNQRGIEALPVLYQWDLPQALQEAGGWENPDTARRFADYALAVMRRLGDRVPRWITHNEMFVASMIAYWEGAHPPGIRDFGRALEVSRQILLSHGLAVRALRGERPEARLGVSTILFPVHPATGEEADRQAARRYDGYLHRWFLEPLFQGRFPPDLTDWYRRKGQRVPELSTEEAGLISQPLDFLGLCYFSRFLVRQGPDPILGTEVLSAPKDHSSDMGWEIYPQGIYQSLRSVYETYRPKEMMISENGIALRDRLAEDGQVHDEERIEFLSRNLAWVHRAVQERIPVSGYSMWSLLDNLEWDLGLSKRFGLVYVDYATLRRIPKDSYRWYSTFVRSGELPERELD